MDEYNYNEKAIDDDTTYFFAIYALYLDAKEKHALAWKEFEHSLVYNDRFHADNIFVDAIIKYKDFATKNVSQDKFFYRARIFNQDPNTKFLFHMKRVMKNAGVNYNEFIQEMNNTSLNDWIMMLPIMNDDAPLISFGKAALRKFHSSRFKGYGAKDSGAPPNDNCISYRINPDHIRYLYLAEDRVTPIYEIRPSLKQNISVAKFKIKRELKIYDLTISNVYASNKSIILDPFTFVCGQFAQPNYNQSFKYLPTQYLSETIKHLGFDGIRYDSSLHSGGINVVLFNPDDAYAVSSDLLQVNNLRIDYDVPSIFKDNNANSSNNT